jgi:hypothetical protein
MSSTPWSTTVPSLLPPQAISTDTRGGTGDERAEQPVSTGLLPGTGAPVRYAGASVRRRPGSVIAIGTDAHRITNRNLS